MVHDFESRLIEFRHIVDMSFSSDQDDSHTSTYDSFNPPFRGRFFALSCPLRITPSPVKKWLSYSPRVRAAIRLAFRIGLGEIASLYYTQDDTEWAKSRVLTETDLKMHLGAFSHVGKSTGDYGQGIRWLDEQLERIHTSGQNVPFHPLFDQRFTAHFAGTALHEVKGFLYGESTQFGLKSAEGLAYLADLIADARAKGYVSSDASKVARLWLNEAQQAFKVEQPRAPRQQLHDFASLFQKGFALSDLNELLRLLGVIGSDNTCITNQLRGKASGKKSKFVAAYRVLHREDLLAPTDDKVWVQAFADTYKVTLGEKVSSYSLKPNGHANEGCSMYFMRGVSEATNWALEWKQRRGIS